MVLMTRQSFIIAAVASTVTALTGADESRDFLAFIEFSAKYGKSYAAMSDHD